MSENTNQPRICEVLGVEINEVWTFGESNEAFRISPSGMLEKRDRDGVWYTAGLHTVELAQAINNPELIQTQPHWTDENRKHARAIRKIFPSAEYLERRSSSTTVVVHDASGLILMEIYEADGRLFNGLKSGKSVALDEILEENVA